MKIMILATLMILILSVVAETAARIHGNGWFGCTTQSDYKLLQHYEDEHDHKMFKTTLDDFIQHKRTTRYRNGEDVIVEKTENDLVQLRRHGEVRVYWTDKAAIS